MGGTGLIDVRLRLRCLKLMWLSNYINSDGQLKILFNYWIERAGWYVFEKTKKKSLQTTPFYEDLFIALRNAEASIRPDFSSKLEVMNIQHFNNTVITHHHGKDLQSRILLANGRNKFHHVVRNNRFITLETGQEMKN